jgi:hypothetical protein
MFERVAKHTILPFFLAGCVAPPAPPAETESESGSTTSGASMTSSDELSPSTGTTAEPVTSSTDGPATSSTTEPSGSSSETTASPPSFDCPPAEGEQQCDLTLQDCPEGFKCIAWDAEGDPIAIDAIVCAPIDDDPVDLYANCTNDIAACTDDCPGGAACLPFYDEAGTCLDLCGEDGVCPGDQVCMTCADCWSAWCVPTCDPLAPECPDTLDGCSLSGQFGQSAFSCGGASGPGGLGDQCVSTGECGAGLFCAELEALGPSCPDFGCCTELCDVNDPDPPCSDPAHVCVPIFIPGQALPSQEHIGICALPEANPCNTPGLCPPPDIDDGAYPWCSTDNEYACPRGIFGFGGFDCTQGCFCIENCAVDADCPVPATGTAVPVCSDQGPGTENDRCVLPCAGGEICPDGMTCAPEWGDVCMWVSPEPPEEC